LSIDLTEKEQAVLNAACVKIEKATAEAQALQRAAEEAARKAEIAGHEARGVYRSLMELSGRNPDAHQVNWDGSAATVSEIPKMETPKVDEPEAPKEPEATGKPDLKVVEGGDA
jgi:hypothetical protein